MSTIKLIMMEEMIKGGSEFICDHLVKVVKDSLDKIKTEIADTLAKNPHSNVDVIELRNKYVDTKNLLDSLEGTSYMETWLDNDLDRYAKKLASEYMNNNFR